MRNLAILLDGLQTANSATVWSNAHRADESRRCGMGDGGVGETVSLPEAAVAKNKGLPMPAIMKPAPASETFVAPQPANLVKANSKFPSPQNIMYEDPS